MNKILAKLDQNESPIPPPDDLLLNRYKDIVKDINRYQRSELYEYLRELYAEYAGVDKEYVWIQPGMDLFFEDILIIENSKRIIVPYPSYFLFMEQVKHYGYNIVRIPLNERFVQELSIVSRNKPSIIYIDNPNNPTGKIIVSKKDIALIAEINSDNIFLIDEAYYEFCNYTLKDLVKEYDNIAVFRTMSKAFSFAGGRVAFGIINPSLARKVFYYNIVRFRISTISLGLAIALLENKSYMNDIVDLIRSERERVIKKIREIGLQVYSSCTNFIMVNTGIPKITELLQKEGVLVKDLGKVLGKEYLGYIRVTIGLPRENNAFLYALEKIIAECSQSRCTNHDTS